jgi:dipeptidase E
VGSDTDKLSRAEEPPALEPAQRHIVAIGGGATSGSVIKYALNLAPNKHPKVLLINTATGDSPIYLVMMYAKLATLGCMPTHLSFFERTPPDLRALVFSHDVVFVGGGNTKSMLAVWREYGLDKILKEAWERGIVLSGSSAGGICWFEGCCTDSYAGSYIALPALGFLKGSCCPHYDGEEGRQETYQGLISNGQLGNGIAIDEGVGVHFIGDSLYEVVTDCDGSSAYSVRLNNKQIVQEKLPARLIRD